MFINAAVSAEERTDYNGNTGTWLMNGSNSTHYEWYDINGDGSKSPYQHEGSQFFNDLSVNLSRRITAYELLGIRLNGTYNDSLYRGKRGLLLEGGSLTWEKGDVSTPFRVTAGDFFASQSDRTIQRSLKGTLLELQPRLGDERRFHSVQIFTGFSAPTYHDFDVTDDYYNGASWLVEDNTYGSFLFSAVHNYREEDIPQSLSDRDQTVLGLAYERSFSFAGQKAEFEMELANFSGDISDASLHDYRKSDNGIFTSLKGRSGSVPLTYSLSFEQYGADFKPNGATTSADQRRYDGKAGWNFINGMNVTGRAQRYEDSIETENPSHTHNYGITFTGPLFRSGGALAVVYLDGLLSTTRDLDMSTDTVTNLLQGNVAIPLAPGLNSGVGFSVRDTEDKTSEDDSDGSDLTLSLTKQFSLYNVSGSVTPSWTLRHSGSSNGNQDSSYPGLALQMERGSHRLLFAQGINFQDARGADATDVIDMQTSVNYTFTEGQHSFSVYADRFGRSPSPGEDTDSYRIGVVYTVSFDKVFRKPAHAAEATAATAAGETGTLLAVRLKPGISMADAEKLLSEEGIIGYIEQSDMRIYEARVFDVLTQRQRLVLELRNGSLSGTSVVVDPDRYNDPEEMKEILGDIRSKLLRRLGQPYEVVEHGEFTDTLAEDIISGRFERTMQWKTDSGVVLLAVPKRLDGKLRVEVIYSVDTGGSSRGLQQVQ
jgi:hypothetical protein